MIPRALLLVAGCFAAAALAADNGASAAASTVVSRYTFSWPTGPGAPAPRGGTTRGAPTEVDREPSPAWQALQQPGITSQERDRRAILAMAGGYRVNFDFLEIASFTGNGDRPRPYQSWGTEKVYIDIDEPRHISLVHILDMRVVGDDGKVGESMVTKHWRQDWFYEPAQVIEYQKDNHWVKRKLGAAERKGQWVQQVYQVDEAPALWRHRPLGTQRVIFRVDQRRYRAATAAPRVERAQGLRAAAWHEPAHHPPHGLAAGREQPQGHRRCRSGALCRA